MSGVGFWELVLLFLIGLIVLGPERLPRVANQLGNWVGQARRMTRVLKRQLEDELNFEKDLNIRPRPAPKALPPNPAPEHEDTYSPAHALSPGTGAAAQPVDNTQPVAEESHDTGDSADEQPSGSASETGDRAAAAGNSKT